MTFDPNNYLIRLKGKDYLEAKYRIVWFREEWPHGTIESQHVEISEKHAIFRCTVTKVDAEGNVKGSATDYGSETIEDFGDFIEKASTKATARALAALGYGTAFAPELDEGERIVDSPVQPRPQASQPDRPAPQAANATSHPQQASKPAQGQQAPPVSIEREAAMKRLHAIGTKHGIDHEGLRRIVVAKAIASGVSITSLADAPGALLADAANAIDADPAKLKAWDAKQVELLPGTDIVPNIGDLPTYN